MGNGDYLGYQILMIIMFGALGLSLLFVAGKWLVLKKTGEKGWKSIIPVYGDMVLCKAVGVWEFYPLVSLGVSFITGSFRNSSISAIITLLDYAFSIYYIVLLCISVARSFGKDTGFGICLMFFGFICYPILGFGNSTFLGPKPINDPLMNYFNKNKSNNNTNDNAGNNQSNDTTNYGETNSLHSGESTFGNYCPQCGTKNGPEAIFCANCGTKLK